jgi:hypothetical protein
MQIQVYTIGPLVLGPRRHEAEIAIANMKSINR